jgi:alpha-tubulin suppressor-like RCC1 family protein
MCRFVALLLAGVLASLVLPAGAAAVAGRPITASVVAVGTAHTCAVTTDGVKCWGAGWSGQIGSGAGTLTSRLPVTVPNLRSGVVAITAGVNHTCALTADGLVECWGENRSGELGTGTTSSGMSIPVDVVGLPAGATAIAAGTEHTCVLIRDGRVFCWGRNVVGQLGDGTLVDRPTAVPVAGLPGPIAAIAVGSNHVCALTTGGGVWCWGYNGFRQAANQAVAVVRAPSVIPRLERGVIAIAAGGERSCAITAAHRVLCWGAMPSGATELSGVPLEVDGLPASVAMVSVGWSTTCVVTTSGAAWCWGINRNGELGDGTTIARPDPVPVQGLDRGVASIVAAPAYHSCAVMTSGGISCWGVNGGGRLGNGGTSRSLVPVPVDFRIRAGLTLATSATSERIARGSTVTFTARVNPTAPTGLRATVHFHVQTRDAAGTWHVAASRNVTASASGLATLKWTFATPGQRSIVAMIEPAAAWVPVRAQPITFTVR